MNGACSDLCGGRSVKGVPTAIDGRVSSTLNVCIRTSRTTGLGRQRELAIEFILQQ